MRLKKHNPDTTIFGLFGGEEKERDMYKERLAKYMDDFYASPFDDPDWKWINGDLMILDWFEKRGQQLTWDSIVVVQWDTLVFDALQSQFAGIKEGEIFLSGARILDREVENQWDWTKSESKERKDYLNFIDYIKTQYDYTDDILCSLFILQVFPRVFFEKYKTVKNKEVGMLEYKIPVYAKIFGIPFYKKDFGVWWFDTKTNRAETPLNARRVEIKKEFIAKELTQGEGYRIFHPYYDVWSIEN